MLVLAAAAALLAGAAVAALGALGFVREWRPPAGAGETALAADRAGTSIYLAQPSIGTGRVVRFDQSGRVVRVLEPATGVDIQRPWGLAVDAAGLLYVFESDRGRVAVVDPAGGVVRTIAPTGSDAFDAFPSTLAVDGAGTLYVANTRRSRIFVFAPGASGAATPIRTIGPLGSQSFVADVAVDAGGNVYALAFFGTAGCEARVEKYGPTGALLTQWGVTSSPTHGCARIGLGVDPTTGDVLVSTQGGTQSGVRRYTSTGAPVGGPILGSGRPGDTLQAAGLAIASNGTLHVVDTRDHRILRFEEGFVAPAPRPPTSPPPPNLAATIPAPQTVAAGPTSATVPGVISLGSLRRSRCIRVVVRTSRPARVLATIFSGRRSIRLFGQREVLFRRPGSRVVCIPVPLRARTFNVRTPLRFALGYRLGTIPELQRPARGPARTRPVIKPIRLVP